MSFRRSLLLEKLAQTSRTSLMQRAAQSHFDGFQIYSPGSAPLRENHAQ
jgi:hypothetical protein